MESTEDVRVGLVGGDGVASTVERVADAVEATGGRTARSVSDASPAADLDAVVTVGERATLDVVRADAGESVPILPVGAGRGVRSVPAAEAAAGTRSLVAAVAGDALRTRPRAVLSVAVDGTTHCALFDAMIVTSEPARISEYAVETPGSRVADVRADGVVAATPAGTHGYAAAADGALLAPGVGALSVVPIAPFVTDRNRWVVDDEAATLRVTRDDAAVTVLADDREVAEIGGDRAVELARDGTVPVAVVPESLPFWPRGRTGLEKL